MAQNVPDPPWEIHPSPKIPKQFSPQKMYHFKILQPLLISGGSYPFWFLIYQSSEYIRVTQGSKYV